MHATMFAAKPGLIYWNERTLALVHMTRRLRHQGIPVFFTIDAGPQVKLVCLAEAVNTVRAAIDPELRVIETGLGEGATLES
jgi:diphosphomevalonate decarboxylase